jgi:GGDEF domain-containing protein
MAERTSALPPPRARAVADLPCDAVLAHADDLARRWASALILTRPLDAIGLLPLRELASEAPALCAQVLRAVQSDVELERLSGRGAPSGREQSSAAGRLSAIAGAHDPAALVDAVEALRGVLWEALTDQLTGPSARQVGDIADRLAYVCAVALMSALDTATPPAAVAHADEMPVVVADNVAAPATEEPRRASTPAGEAVIVDERPRERLAASLPRERPLSWDESPPIPPRAARARLGSVSWDEPPSTAPGVSQAEIEIRDERGEEGPAAWIGSIGAQLERFARDASPFAVLLVELVDIERLRRRESPQELLRLAEQMERALAAEVGAAPGLLTRERPGRCWLLAPGADSAGAERLATRLARAVAAGVSDRGTAVAVVIGTAVCPGDGTEAAVLAAHADVGLYAARSAVRAPTAHRAGPVDEPA